MPATDDTYSIESGSELWAGWDAPYPSVQISGSAWTPNRDGGGLVLSSDWPQLPANTWVTVAGTANQLTDIKPSPAYLDSGGSDGFDSVVAGFSGAAWDYTNQRMYISGGGHGDGSAAENGVYRLALNKLQFEIAVARSDDGDALNWNGSALVSGEGWPSGANYPVADGRPGSKHTYDALVWIPPATMSALGITSTAGGMFSPGNARCVYNLDDGSSTKVWWKRSAPDQSYLMAVLDGTQIILPRGGFTWGRWEMDDTETTDWAAESYDPAPGTPSFGLGLANRTSDENFVHNNKAFCDLRERRECVSFAGNQTAQRMAYGSAIDAAASNWSAYQDTITLDGDDAADFSATNLADSGTNTLCSAGAFYDATNACIWVCANKISEKVYKITGITGTTWTVTAVPGASNITGSGQGTYGRFRVGQIGGQTIGMRVSSVSNPIEIIRLT